MRSEKIATYRVVRTPSFDNVLISAFAWTAIHSTYQGMFDVCAYHEKYCTGDYHTTRPQALAQALALLLALVGALVVPPRHSALAQGSTKAWWCLG